jgi:hypothetical protein
LPVGNVSESMLDADALAQFGPAGAGRLEAA